MSFAHFILSVIIELQKVLEVSLLVRGPFTRMLDYKSGGKICIGAF